MQRNGIGTSLYMSVAGDLVSHRYDFYRRNEPLRKGKLAIIKDAPLAVNLRRIADEYGIVMASVEINQRVEPSRNSRLDGVEVDAPWIERAATVSFRAGDGH